MLDIMYRIAIGFLNFAIIFSLVAFVLAIIFGIINLILINPLFAIVVIAPTFLFIFYIMGEDTIW